MTHKFMSMVNPNRAWKHRSSSKIRFVLLSLGLLGVVSFEVGRGVAQQPSTSIAPIFSTNAKYVNGVAPGYWPTAGAGLALNLSAGASYCGNPPVRVPYAAGTLTLTANATNYVYIDPGGLVPPGTPALSTATTGGTLAAGVYRVETTYLNPSGETLPSAEATITTTGTTSTITITAPAASGNAIGWNIYVTAVGGATGTETKQNATPAAIGTNFTLGSVSAGAALPAASTSNCAPTFNTSGFAVGQIPVATVVTGASSITAITDMRGTGFAPLPCAVDSMGGVQCSTASSNQDFVISPSGNGSLYVNSNITSSMTDARIRAEAASSADSARVSLFVPGVTDWEMRTDEGSGTILRFGSGPGDGTINNEDLRFDFYKGTFLRRLNNIRFADQFTGADACAQITAALADLGGAGIVDARGFTTNQTCAAGFTVGASQTLILAPVTFTTPATINITVGGTGTSGRLVGMGAGTVISYTGSGYAIQAYTGNGGQPSAQVYMDDFTVKGTASGAGGVRLVAFNGGVVRNVYVSGFTTGDGFRNEGANTVDYFGCNSRSNMVGIRNVGIVVNAVNYSANAIHWHGGQISNNTSYGWYEDATQAGTVGPNQNNGTEGVVFDFNGTNGSSTLVNVFIQRCDACYIKNSYLEYGGGVIPLKNVTLGDAVNTVNSPLIQGNWFGSSGSTSTIDDFNSANSAVEFNTEVGTVTNFYNHGTASRASIIVGNRAAAATNYLSGFDSGADTLTIGQGNLTNSLGATATGVGFNSISGLGQDLAIRTRVGGTLALNVKNAAGSAIDDIVDATGNIETVGSFHSSVATGTAPLIVASTTPVANLSLGGGSGTSVKSNQIAGAINAVTFSATPTFDASLGNTQTVTLTGNVTSSTLSNCAAGEFLVFDIIQDAAGSRTFVWPTNILNAGTIGGTASKHNIQTFYCDGANARATGAMLTNQN